MFQHPRDVAERDRTTRPTARDMHVEEPEPDLGKRVVGENVALARAA
jgi:hypothetical protein